MEKRAFNRSGFTAWLSEGRLMAARCKACGEIHLPPRALCARCYSADMEWQQLSGAGRLEGFTWIHVGLPGMAAAGFSRENPYCSGVVRLAEGPAISGQIVGVEGHPQGPVWVGMPVQAVFMERGTGGERQVVLGFQRL